MFKKRAALPIAALAIGLAVPATAQDAKADPLAKSTFSKLVAGDSRGAVAAFFSTSAIMQTKPQDIAYLTSQIDTTVSLYGPISSCDLVDTVEKSNLLVRQTYLCVHEKYMTRWELTMARTSKGWIGATIQFDDDISKVLD